MAETKIRNIRVSDEDWAALDAYARAMGSTRAGVIVKWVHDLIPPMYWPAEAPAEGQMTIDGVGTPDGRD